MRQVLLLLCFSYSLRYNCIRYLLYLKAILKSEHYWCYITTSVSVYVNCTYIYMKGTFFKYFIPCKFLCAVAELFMQYCTGQSTISETYEILNECIRNSLDVRMSIPQRNNQGIHGSFDVDHGLHMFSEWHIIIITVNQVLLSSTFLFRFTMI